MKKHARKIRILVIAILAIILILATTGCQTTNINYSLESRAMYGPIDGDLQTPKGGAPGTTSPNRPTFDELGIDNVLALYEELNVQYKDYTAYFGYLRIAPEETEGIDSTLISENTTYPAGTRVSSDIQLDHYTLGLKSRLLDKPEFVLSSVLEFYLFDFDYKLDAPGLSTDRSYGKNTFRIGANIDWMLNERLTIHSRAMGSIGTADLEVYSVEAALQCLMKENERVSIYADLGVFYQDLTYRDDQIVPNDLHIELGPLVSAGLRITF